MSVYNICNFCNKITDLYVNEHSLDNNIDNFNFNYNYELHKIINGKVSYYFNPKTEKFFQTCSCNNFKFNINFTKFISNKYNLPSKKTVRDISTIIMCDDVYYSYHNLSDTLMPSDKEYFELTIHISNYKYNPLKFHFLNISDILYEKFVKNKLDINNIFQVGFNDNSISQLLDYYKFYKSNKNFKSCLYFKRLNNLKIKGLFKKNFFTDVLRKKNAKLLREKILESMYNPRTNLGLKMFNIRLKLDEIDTFFQ